jgi:hypothetical protein
MYFDDGNRKLSHPGRGLVTDQSIRGERCVRELPGSELDCNRRLIFIATCALLDAAFGRIDYLFNHDLTFVCLDGVILLGVARDLLVSRRIHPVYRIVKLIVSTRAPAIPYGH